MAVPRNRRGGVHSPWTSLTEGSGRASGSPAEPGGGEDGALLRLRPGAGRVLQATYAAAAELGGTGATSNPEAPTSLRARTMTATGGRLHAIISEQRRSSAGGVMKHDDEASPPRYATEPVRGTDPTWDRLLSQLEWYEEKSQFAQHAYKRVKVAQIVLAAGVPVAVAGRAPSVLTAVLGALVVVLEGVQQLNQW